MRCVAGRYTLQARNLRMEVSIFVLELLTSIPNQGRT